jgi:hypothetical protein
MPILSSRGALNNKVFGGIGGGGGTPIPPSPPRLPGYLFTVGDNQYGQLGLGTTGGTVTTPTQVGTDTNWYTGDYSYNQFGIMIKSNGTMWGCGHNTNYELGLGNTTNYNTFQQIGSATNWAKVSCGYYGSLALKTDGTMWGWGRFEYFGTSSSHIYTTPTQIGTDTDWIDVIYYNYIAIALKSNGTLWTAGDNRGGSCGRGLSTYSGTFYPWGQVGSATNWKYIHSVKNGSANFAINSNNELYGAGYLNILGGITNDFTYINTPQPVIAISGGIPVIDPAYDSYGAISIYGTGYSLGNSSIINPGHWIGIATSWTNNGLTMSEIDQGPYGTVYRDLENEIIYSGETSYATEVVTPAQYYGYNNITGINNSWFIQAP